MAASLAIVMLLMPSVGLPCADAFVLNAHPALSAVRLGGLALAPQTRPLRCGTGRLVPRQILGRTPEMLRMCQEASNDPSGDEKVGSVSLREQAVALDKEAGRAPFCHAILLLLYTLEPRVE